jgi:TRAP-type C4-dicarboxylate transport system substrate-binding protein
LIKAPEYGPLIKQSFGFLKSDCSEEASSRKIEPKQGVLMFNILKHAVVAASLVAASAGFAEPVVLKLNHTGTADDVLFAGTFTPWAKVVNAEAPDALKIELFHSGALGRNMLQQPQMLLDDVFDIGLIVPGLTPGRFVNNQGTELPGLFRDVTEATRVREMLLKDNKLDGYDEFHVLAITTAPPMNVLLRTPISTVTDLKGKKIRAANTSDTELLKALGAVPVFMPVIEITEAIGRRTIDGATSNPQTANDFGFNRITNTMMFTKGVTATLTIAMTKKKLASLPPKARAVMEKYSTGMADYYLAAEVPYNTGLEKKMRTDANFKVIDPSPADMQVFNAAAKNVIDAYVGQSEQSRKLLIDIEAATAKVRALGPDGSDAKFLR